MEKSLTYLNIEISENGLSEFSGNRRIIFIPKAEIQSVKVRFGSSAERPVVQVIAGLLLLGLGIAGAAMVMASGMRGVLRGLRWGLGFMVFGAFGVWFLHETFKKTHYLHVTSHKDSRKLVFRGEFKDAELNQFLLDGAKLGYVFESGQ
jgi:hypothetical protein